MDTSPKPKLVFFQWAHQEIPKFLDLHLSQHVKCLSEFFEVFVINGDCDYQQICDQYQPDLVLFESSVYAEGKREIKNTSAHPEIPKLGFIHSDAYCMSREAIISDMANWGINTFFSLCVSMAEYTPEIADNLFIWPNFIDSDLYQNYGESKIVPILLTGSQSAHYPWRNRIRKIVAQYYPTLNCPHFGWSDKKMTSRMIFGEQYARMLNASWIIPACGTIAKELVRKHLEIPASKSCLLTEKTPVLEAAGFVDLQNCIFADEHDVLDKLDYVFQHPDELTKIIDAGYQLVHSRHTLKQRNQIFQWFTLYKTLKPHQKIAQTSPFEPLTVVEKSSGIQNSHIISHGVDRVILQKGDRKLCAGQYNEAEALYLQCLNYHSYIPEPKLRLTLCNLYKGNAEIATSWILPPIKTTLETYAATEPDPVEWAYLIICRLCQGRLDDAVRCANRFPSLHHPELERARWAVDVLSDQTNYDTNFPKEFTKYRYTLHQLPHRNLNEWVENICLMLKQCQKLYLAEKLQNCVVSQQSSSTQIEQKVNSFEKLPQYSYQNWLNNLTSTWNRIFRSQSNASLGLIQDKNSTRLTKFIKSQLKQFVLQPLNRLEAKYGYFLPYRFSEMKNDEFFGTIQEIIREEDIQAALIIGADCQRNSTEALLTGISENRNQPRAFCLNTEIVAFTKLQKKYNNTINKFYSIPVLASSRKIDEFENRIKQIKQENGITSFDAILISGLELDISEKIAQEFSEAKFVLLENINTLQNQKNYQKLLADAQYILEIQNPSLRGGYAIFKNTKLTSYLHC